VQSHVHIKILGNLFENKEILAEDLFHIDLDDFVHVGIAIEHQYLKKDQ
jgi:hypothetical protein